MCSLVNAKGNKKAKKRKKDTKQQKTCVMKSDTTQFICISALSTGHSDKMYRSIVFTQLSRHMLLWLWLLSTNMLAVASQFVSVFKWRSPPVGSVHLPPPSLSSWWMISSTELLLLGMFLQTPLDIRKRDEKKGLWSRAQTVSEIIFNRLLEQQHNTFLMYHSKHFDLGFEGWIHF